MWNKHSTQDGGESLMEAARRGDVADVKRLIAGGVEVDWRDESGTTALCWAALYENLDVVRELLASRAQLDVQDHEGYSPLHCAAGEGHVTVVEELCRQGAQVDIAQPGGATPLYIAAHEGHTAAVNALLQGGASVEQARPNGVTPLFKAAQNGHTAAVNALLQGGALVELAAPDGVTPLFIAAQYGHTDAVNALLQGGATVAMDKDDGVTPLLIAAYNGHTAAINALLQGGAMVDLAAPDGVTPLFIAARNGHTDAVNALLQAGATVDLAMDHGAPSLFIAAQNGHMGAVNALLQGGATVGLAAPDGATPLFIAAQHGHTAAVNALLQGGAAVDLAKDDGATPLYIAAQKGHTAAVNALLQGGAAVDVAQPDGATPLFIAAQNGHTAAVNALLQGGITIDLARPQGDAPLFIAAQNGHTAAVNALLQGGAKVDLAMDHGATPLFIAAQEGNTAAVNALLQGGAKVDLVMDNGATPLYVAAQNGHTAAVNALLQSGAKVDMATDTGATPLLTAAHNGHINIVSTLLHKNASVNLAAKDGQTPLTAAAHEGRAAIVRELLTAGASQLVRYACPIPLVQAVQRKDMPVVYGLMQLNEDFNRDGSEDFTALQWASFLEKSDVVEYLLDHDKKTRMPPKLGWSHLHQVAESGGVKATRILIQRDAAVDARDAESRTPLHLAAAEDHGEVAQVLVDHGADINIQNKSQETPLHVCARYDASSVAKVLIRKCANGISAESESSLIYLRAKYDSVDVARLLREENVNSLERTALDIAVHTKNVSAAKALVGLDDTLNVPQMEGVAPVHWSAGANNDMLMNGYLREPNINVNIQDSMGRTALHLTGLTNSLATADVLLKANACCETLSNDGDPPLFTAYRKNSSDVFWLLLRHRFKVRDREENTILHLAAQSSDSKIIGRLLAERREIADFLLEGVNNEGNSALHLAIKADHIDAASLLVQAAANRTLRNMEGNNALDIAVLEKNTAAAKILVGLDNSWSAPGMVDFTSLHWSAVANNVILMTAYLRDPINVNIQDSMGRTALHLTALTNSLATADLLLKANACCEMLSNDGDPPLFTAYRKNSSDVFWLLLSHQFKVRDREGNTILHLAAQSSDSKVIGRLVAERREIADFLLEGVNNEGNSALHLAIKEDQIDAASLLVQAGVNRTVRNQEGNNALDLAVLQKNAAAAKILVGLDNTWSAPGMVDFTSLHWSAVANNFILMTDYLRDPINVNIQDIMGRTALHLTGLTNSLATAELLLKANACCETLSNDGDPPLFTAFRKNSSDVFWLLLSHQFKVRDREGNNILHLVAQSSDSKVISRLLAEQREIADFLLDCVNNEGNSALNLAIKEDRINAVSLLVQAGANCTVRNMEGNNALDLAVLQKNAAAAKNLVGSDNTWSAPGMVDFTSLHWSAVANNVIWLTAYLREPNINVNMQDSMGRTALHLTGLTNILAAADFLLKANACCETLSNDGDPPLFTAFRKNSSEVFWLLLSHQFKVRDRKGNTILHLAAQSSDSNAISRLLAEQREIANFLLDCVNNEGNSALNLAIKEDHIEAVSLLVQAGANRTVQNVEGDNALDLAVLQKNAAASKLLVGLDNTLKAPGMVDFTSLHWCAVANNIDLVKYYLDDSKTNVDIQDTMGRTALHLTGITNGFQTADLLLKTGANVELKAKDGDPPLFTAYHYNSRDVFTRLLSHRCDVTSRSGDNIVHIAAKLDDSKVLAEEKQMIQSLLKKTNNKGDTALHVAAAEDSVEAATALLQAGADTSALNADRKKPVDLVGEKWNMLYLLQEADTGTMSTGTLGEMHQRVADGDDTLTDSQLKENIEESSSEGLGLLHVAVIHSRLTMVKRLLKLGASVNVQDNKGRSVLHLATRQPRLEITKLLLEIKACDIYITDKLGRSPLHWAARENSPAMIKCLLEAGASASLHADDYKTPVHILLENKIDTDKKNKENQESTNLLLKYLHKDIKQEQVAILAASALSSLIMSHNPAFKMDKIGHLLSNVENERLFSSPCYLSNQTKGLLKEVSERWSRYTVFMALVEYYPPERLVELLRLTTEATINSKNFLQQNTLHILAEKQLDGEGEDLLKDKAFILIGKNLDFMQRDVNGRSPLHLACQYQHIQLARYLLGSLNKKGSLGSLNDKDKMGRTALHHLIRNVKEMTQSEDGEDLIKELITCGANPAIRDYSGESALECGFARQVKDITAHPLSLRMHFPQITGQRMGGLHRDRTKSVHDEQPKRLGGINVVNEHNIDNWISTLRENYSSNSAVHYFLNSTKMGPLRLTYSNRDDVERIGGFVTELCSTALSKMNVKGHIELGGSMAEGTKVGPVDEMDFLLRLTEMEKSVNVSGIEGTGGSAFAKLSSDKGELKAAEEALHILDAFLGSLKVVTSLPEYGISLEDIKRNKLKVFTLVLNCAQESGDDLVVTIDIVPSIIKELDYHSDWEPSVRSCEGEESDGKEQIRNVRKVEHNNIEEAMSSNANKQNGKESPPMMSSDSPVTLTQQGVVNQYAQEGIIRERKEFHYRKEFPLLMKKDGFEVSFSELEHKALQEMKPHQQNAYMLLKAMRADEICPRLTSMKKEATIEDILPSYLFKMGLLWVVDPEGKRAKYPELSDVDDLPGEEEAEDEKIRLLALEVLKLTSARNSDTIPSYFCPSSKLRLTHSCKLLSQIMSGVLK